MQYARERSALPNSIFLRFPSEPGLERNPKAGEATDALTALTRMFSFVKNSAHDTRTMNICFHILLWARCSIKMFRYSVVSSNHSDSESQPEFTHNINQQSTNSRKLCTIFSHEKHFPVGWVEEVGSCCGYSSRCGRFVQPNEMRMRADRAIIYESPPQCGARFALGCLSSEREIPCWNISIDSGRRQRIFSSCCRKYILIMAEISSKFQQRMLILATLNCILGIFAHFRCFQILFLPCHSNGILYLNTKFSS